MNNPIDNNRSNFTIRTDHELKIVRYTHSGDITKTDIGEAWDEFMRMEEFTHQKYNLLSDYRDGRFNIPLEEVDEIVNILYALKEILSGKKQSIIINDPYSTAGTVLFKHEVYEKVGFLVEIFSTEEAAIDWLTS
jgi:hypothetical protein